MYKVTVKVFSSPRDIVDPATSVLKGMKRRQILVNVNDLPEGIPTDPNPRDAKPTSKTYLDIIDSLNSDDGIFHLKNKGITIVAEDTDFNPNTKILTISFKKGDSAKSSHGILDGGHTYDIITNKSHDGLKNQYVPVTILTGIPHEKIPEVAEGLNNSTALTVATKQNHNNLFEWIKASLAKQAYADNIVYFQNDVGRVKVESIIAIMTAANVELFPIKGEQIPTMAYNHKQGCLAKFADNTDSYRKFENILPDLLMLYDYISESCYIHYNKRGGLAGGLSIFNATPKPTKGTRRKHKFEFSGEQSYFRLEQGVNIAILSTLRVFIKVRGGKFVWDRSVTEIKKIIDSVAADLVKDAQDVYKDVANLTSLGKSPNLWKSVMKTVRLEM